MDMQDVLIVGAGPIGIELAVALKRAGVDYAQLDAGPIGSTLTWWAPQTRFFSSPERIQIAGVPLQTVTQDKATREEYLTYLRGVVQQFDLDISTYERVTSIRRVSDHFELTTHGLTGERERRARTVVLAIGDMHKPKLLDIPGEHLEHVSHYFRDPHQYFRKRVLIVGGKNSAVEAAIRCYRVGAHVTIAYRKSEFSERVKYWLRPELLHLIKTNAIGFLPQTTPVEITPGSVLLARTDETGAPTTDTHAIETDFVLMMTGYRQDPTLLEQVGVELQGEGRAPTYNGRTMETNVPGLYVAGTAAAGTQIGGVKVFIETAHVHVTRIAAALTGIAVEEDALETPEYALPES
ncbi:MAG: NAD(P)-binding domain-containing protein [Planctomycetota bacterium]